MTRALHRECCSMELVYLFVCFSSQCSSFLFKSTTVPISVHQHLPPKCPETAARMGCKLHIPLSSKGWWQMVWSWSVKSSAIPVGVLGWWQPRGLIIQEGIWATQSIAWPPGCTFWPNISAWNQMKAVVPVWGNKYWWTISLQIP